MRQVARPQAQPTIQGMRDVDRICFRELDERGLRQQGGLRLQPCTIHLASGTPYVALFVDIGSVTKAMHEDPATALAQDCLHARVEPPGMRAISDGRRFESILTGDWALEAQAKAPPGAMLFPLSCFWDDTVRSSTGAKYCGLQLYNNRLPRKLRFQSDNIWLGGFVPIVQPPTADPAYAALTSKGARQAWMKRERDSMERGVLKQLLLQFGKYSSGIRLQNVVCPKPHIVIPILACWWLDHPKHMAMSGCRQCGFCNVGREGKQALADFDKLVELRTTATMRELVEHGDREALDAAGVNDVRLLQWDEPFTDAYPSPLHVKKGIFKDAIEWTLRVLCHPYTVCHLV